MKKIMMTLAAVLCCAMTVSAQDAQEGRNRTHRITLEGDDISLCKVQSGGKDIKTAIDNGEQLMVISID